VNNKRELLSGIVFLVVAVAYFAATYTIQITQAFAVSVLTSASIPRILAGILFILSLIQIISSRKVKTKPAEAAKAASQIDEQTSDGGVDIGKEMKKAEANESSSQYDTKNIVLTVVFLLVYLFAMTYLGFTIASFIYMLAQIMIMTKKENRKKKFPFAVVLSLIASLCMYFLFNDLLGVLLPTGPFGF
jgi:putative tricarboxylic transport membrane protein